MRKSRRGWKDEPLVDIDRDLLLQAMREAKSRGRSRRDIARGVSRRVQELVGRPVPPQTLDQLCNDPARRARASVRRALAEELGVPELDHPAGLVKGVTGRQAEVFLKWSTLVLDLEIWRESPAAHEALLRLPSTLPLAMLHLWEGGASLKGRTPPPPWPSWFIRLSTEEQRAWNEWLQRWMDQSGRASVRKVIIKHAQAIRARFVGVERYWKPKDTRDRRQTGARTAQRS
jgi:hypothetical protein